MTDYVSYSHGSLFPSTMKFFGLVLCLTIVLIPIGIIIFFSEQGAEFKPQQKLYRHYSGLWGIRFGKWKSYHQYSDIAFLSIRRTASTFSRSNRVTSMSETANELYLLTPDHRRKLLACVLPENKVFKDEDFHNLANDLGVKYTNYSPKISAATKARRR